MSHGDVTLHDQSDDGDMISGMHLRERVKEAIVNGAGLEKVQEESELEMMDDDEAEEMRKFFGVF